MSKTLAEMTAETRAVNIEKGWRPAEGGPGLNTWGDYIALLHSEVSEALEAYRDHRLADATALIKAGDMPAMDRIAAEHQHPPKPEGVGAELADVLIRLIDMADVFGVELPDMDMELGDVSPADMPMWARTFGDDMAWLHQTIAAVPHHAGLVMSGPPFAAVPLVLRTLVAVAGRYGIDLDAEYERKQNHNRTRSFQHGGRTLADGPHAR